MTEIKLCSVDGCGKARYCKGLCTKHYQRLQQGRPMADPELMNEICSIDGCGKPTKARGWCAMHLWRFNTHGDPLTLAVKPEKPEHCSVDGCDNPPNGKRGMCNSHYLKWYRYGDPNIRFAASPGETYQWLLDHMDYDGDGCLTWPFATGTDGRGMLSSHYQGTPQAHRVMTILTKGPPPSDIHEAAHSCGKGHEGCVHPKHLRWATPLENAADKIIHGTNNGTSHGFYKKG